MRLRDDALAAGLRVAFAADFRAGAAFREDSLRVVALRAAAFRAGAFRAAVFPAALFLGDGMGRSFGVWIADAWCGEVGTIPCFAARRHPASPRRPLTTPALVAIGAVQRARCGSARASAPVAPRSYRRAIDRRGDLLPSSPVP